MVRFPSSFEWVKGGTLPGLWINDVLQGNFGWRAGGEGHLSTALIGLSKPDRDQQQQSTTSFTKKPSKLARPFYFVPEQWHALQISVSMIDEAGTNDRDRSGGESRSQISSERSLFRQASVKGGAMVELRAFVDFELVSTITYPYSGRMLPSLSRNSRDRGPSLGLLLCCHFGGKTQDWATAEDTHIDFSQVSTFSVIRSRETCEALWTHHVRCT